MKRIKIHVDLDRIINVSSTLTIPVFGIKGDYFKLVHVPIGMLDQKKTVTKRSRKEKQVKLVFLPRKV